MAKVKVISNNLDQNLNGDFFNNTASQTIFSFGSFAVTSNFEGRKYIDYRNKLSSFVRAVTLETMGVSQTQSDIIQQYTTNAVLNLDKSDLNTFIRFGSAYEFLRVTIQNIIVTYPGSIFANSQINRNGNITFYDLTYNPILNISTFKVPIGYIVNTFGLIINNGNLSKPDNIELKNLNLSYDKYIIWSPLNPTGNSYTVIGFTGYTSSHQYLTIQTIGNPFPSITGTSGSFDFHIKPNNVVFEEFRALLSDYEKYVISTRNGTDGFQFVLKDPTLLDDGTIIYSNKLMLWTTGDKYNVDINTPKYRNFLDIILSIGNKYDTIKTDLIARFLTPDSLKTYDLTEEGKMTKLLRIYGKEFDELREFIDSLVNINHITYDKVNNIPDQLIKNLARTFGWEYFSLVNENELVSNFLSIDDNERDLNSDLLPAEIDIELWRRILMNTNYFWKSKGTRQAIKSIFLLIGIPEPFINITEYVYTVDGKINPNTVILNQADFPSNSLPYDTEGYPVAPLETNDFFFQLSGDTDSGQAYLDVFRMAGFNLRPTIDNKKSWIQTGATTRIHYDTPQYYQEDSKLVINTKEIDVALDTARGIEYDIYYYIKTKDFPINSSGYTQPFSFVNISLDYTGSENTFTLPIPYNAIDKKEGDLEVRFNGILLNAPKEYDSGGIYAEFTKADYIISGNTFTLTNSNFAINSGNRRDVIQATFVYSGGTKSISGITAEYIVTRVKPNLIGTVIPLPSYPRGDVQVTINGIALTKGTPQFIADYIVDPNNTVSGTSNIIIQNPEIISYLAVQPNIQVTYLTVAGSNDIAIRSEVVRVDSFNSSKIYFNNSANKYVYKLNYKANNASDLKVLIDGIALEPNRDYTINVQNPYEIFLPRGIKFGTVITIYYIVGGSAYFIPLIQNYFGLGDISKLSFLEFLELIQRKMINARNRKTIGDYYGGWYPALLSIYVKYLKRSTLSPNDPLHSNGYTFENLYSFLSKYNAFFKRFVDQLLPATIILKGSGLLIRNSIFSKQKFTYKRGVNFDFNVNYLGDDGSMFMIKQDISAPQPPPVLFVDTITGITGIYSINNTGGEHIIGNNILTEYGMQYSTGTTWSRVLHIGTLGIDNYNISLTGLSPNTLYHYRAYIKSGDYGYTGNTLDSITLPLPIIPTILTKQGTVGTYSINNTGGESIIDWGNVEYYAMQYRAGTIGTWLLSPVVPVAGPLLGNNYIFTISGLSSNITGGTLYQYRAYMIVDGTPYYGQTRQITTLSIPTFVPTVVTSGITSIALTTASGGGNVTSDGGVAVTARGIAWNTSPNPTVANSHTTNGSGTGAFTSSLIGLLPNTTYYVKAYATNSVGTGYQNQVSFTTLPLPTVSLPLVRTNLAGIGQGQQSYGTIIPSPALSIGQCITVNFSICHVVFGTGVGQNLTTIYCCCAGGIWQPVNPSPFITNSPPTAPPNRTNAGYSLSVTLHVGEQLCYVNQLSSTASLDPANKSCSCLGMSCGGSSSDISVVSSGNDCLSM